MTNLIKRKMSGGCFKLLCIISFGLILSSHFVSGQSTTRSVEKITDDNFKKQIAKGLIVVKFTAPYQMAAVDKKLFESVLVSGLKSALTAGATQKLSLAKSGTPYKGFDISSLFGGEEWSPMNYAGDFSPEFLSQFAPKSSRPHVGVDKPAWDKSIYK